MFRHALEFQPRFARRFGQRRDPAVILVSTAIEDDEFDTRGASALGDFFADGFGRGNIAAGLEILARFLVDRAGRSQRAAGAIVDNLRVNVADRAIHGEARPLRGALDAHADAAMNSLAMRVARKFPNWLQCHVESPYGAKRPSWPLRPFQLSSSISHR